MNPAKDFVKIGMQSVLVLVPQWRAAAAVRVIADKLPAPPVRHNEALWRTCDATQHPLVQVLFRQGHVFEQEGQQPEYMSKDQVIQLFGGFL